MIDALQSIPKPRQLLDAAKLREALQYSIEMNEWFLSLLNMSDTAHMQKAVGIRMDILKLRDVLNGN